MIQKMARIISKFENKNEKIFIAHGDVNYRLIIKKDKINNINFSIGDIVKFEGNRIIGKYSDKYIEYDCDNIVIVKKTLLAPNESGINKDNKYTGTKERQFFHTKMIIDDKCIEKLKIHDLVLKTIRNYLSKEKFIECRTPIITNTFHGGGALPFETYVNYKHKKNYLRANSIFPLSMYLAGGLTRVYEIGEYFRNGSVSKAHSVPYLAAEIYSTDIAYDDAIEMAKAIFNNIITEVNKAFNYDISNQIEIIDFEKFMKKNEFNIFSMEELQKYYSYKKIKFSENNYENINNLYRLLKEEIIPSVTENIMITNLPAGISPLIDHLESNDKLLKRTLFIYKGYTIMEIAYSSNDSKVILEEINNQNIAFQVLQKEQINKSCVGYEHALKLGILPMSSITISVERLISLICNNENIIENLIEI